MAGSREAESHSHAMGHKHAGPEMKGPDQGGYTDHHAHMARDFRQRFWISC